MPDSHTPPAEFSIDSTEGGGARLRLSGDWSTVASLPSLARLEEALAKTPAPVVLKFDAAPLTGWNTRLLAFVLQCRELCEARQVTFDPGALPEGLQRLVTLYLAVPARLDARRSTPPQALLHRLGVAAQELGGTVMDLITFCGECVLALGQWVRGRARFRTADLFLIMQQTGPQALGIVALINFMVGLILAFLGAVQLKQFGAAIFLADMVAVGAVRELSPIMTGIIVSGRTGAAFAAQLGTMKVNEEIDAFTSFGFPPVEFLVLPRLVALLVMMPLLCVFAAFIAILGPARPSSTRHSPRRVTSASSMMR